MSCAGLVLKDGDRVVLVKNLKGQWSFPKGKYEQNKDGGAGDLKSLYKCARRETWEETHLVNFEYKYLKTPKNLLTSKGNISCVYFLAEITHKLSTFLSLPLNDDEIVEVRWFNENELLNLPNSVFLENRRDLALLALRTPVSNTYHDVFIDRQREVAISKKISYELRHKIKDYTADSAGYVPISELVRTLNSYLDESLMKGELEYIVENNDKQRFSIEGDKIRANQGHSSDSGVSSEALCTRITEPLEYCVHGTTKKNASLIKKNGGLNKMGRDHIHMAIAPDATSGFRKSSQVLIHVNTKKLLSIGHKLYLSSNGVCLSEDPISLEYLRFEYL